MGDGVVAADLTGHMLVYNAAAERLIGTAGPGVSPEDWPRHYGFYLPDTITPYPASQLPLARAMRGQQVDGAEIFVRNKCVPQGIWVSSTSRPLRDKSGDILGGVTVFRDITERKRAEQSMGESERFYRLLFEKNRAGILRTTEDGKILACNDGFARMLGFRSPDELLGLQMQDFYFDLEHRQTMLSALGKTGFLPDQVFHFRRLDGGHAWAIANLNLIDATSGQSDRNILGTMIDITERKHWEDTLRRSEEQFSSFMRHLPGVAFRKDLSGRYSFIGETPMPPMPLNPTAVGKLDEEIWPPEVAARLRENDERVRRTRQPVETIEALPQNDGLHFWLMCRFPILDEDGKIAFLGGIGIDITERKRMEERLEESNKMEAVGRLAGGVAHDFNNLLTVISGYGQLILDNLEKRRSPDNTKTYLEALLEASKRAAALTNQLLVFSRRQVVQPKLIDVNTLIGDMEPLLRGLLRERIELRIDTPSAPCLIKADPTQIEQLIMNLAANARDAMPHGGRLDIRAGFVERRPHRSFVLLEVSDSGNGMDADTRAHVFEPFFSSKSKGKGTGLGLSTVYGIVKQSGGEVSVESELGHGTTFRILLPLAEGTWEASTQAPHSAAVTGGTETVLLVEDELIVRNLVREMLLQQGYAIIEASDGRDALRVYEANRGRIDLVLTDVIMPHMGGRELAQKIAEKDPGLRTIFMSGYTGDLTGQHGVLPDYAVFLQKPFTPAALSRKLRDVLDR